MMTLLVFWLIGTILAVAWPAAQGIAMWSNFDAAATVFGQMWTNLTYCLIAWAVLHWFAFITLPWPAQRHRKLASFRAALSLTLALVLAWLSENGVIDITNWHGANALWFAGLCGLWFAALVYGVNGLQTYMWTADARGVEDLSVVRQIITNTELYGNPFGNQSPAHEEAK